MEKAWQRGRSRRMVASLLSVAFILFGSGVTAYAAAPTELIPVGRAAGIKMLAEGVMVVRISAVQTESGEQYPAKQAGLREGDQIVTVNGKQVTSNESLQKAVTAAGNKAVTLKVSREGQQLELKVVPACDTGGKYKIGVMVRDSMAGIGTITYVNPETGEYGSLGHGICDADTGTLLPLSKGNVMEAAVSGVQKGEAGKPGELKGEFNLQQDMGTVEKNTPNGVFGVLSDDSYYKTLSKMQVAKSAEVRIGPAQVLSNIEGENTALYAVEITKIYDENDELGRCMMLHVTDPKLLQKTGGIVQGMSGSPVIQNGKLVGAVTHVLVNDPTRGYAIFIEKMIGEMTE